MSALEELRDQLIDLSDWDASPTADVVARLNAFIDRAVQAISLEAPFLFNETEIRFRTQTDVEPTLSTDTITMKQDAEPASTPYNPWIFQADLMVTTPDAVVWANDRSWDGRDIDIIDASDGTVLHRTTIQSVSLWTDGKGDKYARIAITVPFDWETHGVGPFSWKVYTRMYYLPDDVIEYRSGRILDSSFPYPFRIFTQHEAEAFGYVDHDFDWGTGQPRGLYRRGHLSIPGPNTAPLAQNTNVQQFPWAGPEPFGSFSYQITWTWGKREAEYQNPGTGLWSGEVGKWLNTGSGSSQGVLQHSENRFREPLFESAPSPISATVTVVEPSAGGVPVAGVQLTLPNIEYMLGYLMSGTTTGSTPFTRLHHAKSGWHIRIYRRRHSVGLTNYTDLGVGQVGQHISELNRIDLQDGYYLLAEMPCDDFNKGIFYDLGEIIPDYRRRLRDVHGYQAVRFHPPPDQEYDISIRALRRPPRLVSDRDSPQIHAEASDLIVYKALTYLYEHAGNPVGVARSHQMYDDRLRTLRKRFGDLKPEHVATYKRPARAEPQNRLGYRWWRRS